MKEREFLIDVGLNSLREAYKTQKRLQAIGKLGELVKRGAGGDIASRADVESEEAVINYLKKINFPCRIISEEHGEVNLGNNHYVVTLDGLDGSSGLVANPRSRCGTMIGIAENPDPLYRDFIFGGITEFVTERIFYGSKGNGLWMIENCEYENEKIKRIKKIRRKNFGKNSLINIDDPEFYSEYAEGITSGLNELGYLVHTTFSEKLRNKCEIQGRSSSAAMFVDLILGDVDAVCGVIAKGVFEPPVEYILLSEAGGFVCGLDGKDIGDKKWAEYGRPESALLRAGNSKIAEKILKIINQ